MLFQNSLTFTACKGEAGKMKQQLDFSNLIKQLEQPNECRSNGRAASTEIDTFKVTGPNTPACSRTHQLGAVIAARCSSMI